MPCYANPKRGNQSIYQNVPWPPPSALDDNILQCRNTLVGMQAFPCEGPPTQRRSLMSTSWFTSAARAFKTTLLSLWHEKKPQKSSEKITSAALGAPREIPQEWGMVHPGIAVFWNNFAQWTNEDFLISRQDLVEFHYFLDYFCYYYEMIMGNDAELECCMTLYPLIAHIFVYWMHNKIHRSKIVGYFHKICAAYSEEHCRRP